MGFGKGKGFSPVVEPAIEPEPSTQSSDCQMEHDQDWGYCQLWNAQSQSFTPDHSYYAAGLSLLLTQYAIYVKGPLIVKLEIPATNCWKATVLWSKTLYSTDLPLPGDHRWTSFYLPNILLELGVTYRITVHTTPGWYQWVNGEWLLKESWAAVTWRSEATGSPYPRGSAWIGCNYSAGGGVWTPHVDRDHAFCLRIIEAETYLSLDRACPTGSDDCYTYGTTMRLTYDYIYMDYPGYNMHAYARFTSIPIPPGATIVKAYIDLLSHQSAVGASSLRIQGIKELDTATFSTQADADGRSVTTALVNWTTGTWAAGLWCGGSNDPQDIKAIIQEIIDQAGWASGNALAIKIINTAQVVARAARSREGGNSPHLHIEYEE